MKCHLFGFVRSVLLVIFLASCNVCAQLETIDQLVSYAQSLPEFPEDEYVDPYKPRYANLHRQLRPSSFDRILTTFGLKSTVLYDDIKQRLKSVAKKRELEGFYGDFVQKFYIDVETKWYIWGPLHGAFHSLVRSLSELKKQGVINDHLQLQKKRFKMVFNGNVLNYSPYQLETLSVLVSLIEKNPDQVFIIKGAFEDKESWKKTNFPFELKEKLSLDNENIPIEREVNRFFNTLPLALYLVSTDLDVVRISFFEKHPLLKDEKWGLLLNKKESEDKKIKNILPSKEEVKIRAYISGHNVQQFPYKIESIDYKKSGSIHEWSLFSSPIGLFKDKFQFDEDAAIVLTTGKFFSNWYMELYQQKASDPQGFILSRTFDISTGKEVFTANQEEHIQDLKQKIELVQLEQKRLKAKCGIGDTKETLSVVDKDKKQSVTETGVEDAAAPKDKALQDGVLVVGNMADFSRGSKDWSKLLRKGLKLPVGLANEQGGINGTLIQLVFLDDQYNPELARKNVLTFLNDFKTDVVLGAKGTATLASYIDLIKEKKVLAVFPSTGGFRDPDITYLLHLRASYDDEGRAVAQYAHEVAKRKSRDARFAFFYQKDAYGRGLLKGAKAVLQNEGYTQFLEVPYETYMTDFSEQVQKIKEFKPDIIGLFSLPDPTQKLIRALGARYLLDKTLLGNDRLGQETFREFLNDRGLVVAIPQIVPNPHTSDLPIAQEFRSHARKKKVPVDAVTFEAYIASALFLELISRLGESFSKEALVREFEGLKDYDFKGLKLTFDPSTRQLFDTVWIDVGTNEWVPQEPKISHADRKEVVSADGILSKKSDVFVIGTMQDLSKSAKGIGIAYKKGLMLPVQEVNERGGVNGQKIRLVSLDDQYNPAITRELVEKFINEYKTDILLGAFGTPTLASYLDLIREKKILSVFPYAGSYGELSLPYLIRLRASYSDIGYALTKFMIEQKGKRRLAFFYQDDHFGESNLKGAKQALEQAGIKDFLAVPYTARETDLSEQAEKIMAYKPDAIGLFSVPFPSRRLLEELSVSAVMDKAIFANEFHGNKQFRELAEQKGLDLTVAHVVPNPYKSSLPIVQQYREHAKQAGLALDEGGLEGYIAAALFIDILKAMPKPFSKDAFVSFVENIKNYNFRGLPLHFDPKTRQLFKTIWIDTGEKNWIETKPQDQPM